MEFFINASRNCSIALDNKDTKKIQKDINKNWIDSSTIITDYCAYFIQAGIGGYIKIGRSKKASGFNSRLVQLQTSSPIPYRSILEITVEDYEDYTNEDEYKFLKSEYPLIGSISQSSESILEKSLHQRFCNDRSIGEWFYPSVELLSFILECRNKLLIDGKLGEYNIKKSAILLCVLCGDITFSSTLKCIKCNRRQIKSNCVWCGEDKYKPKWKREYLCDKCFEKYKKEVRNLHRKLFV